MSHLRVDIEVTFVFIHIIPFARCSPVILSCCLADLLQVCTQRTRNYANETITVPIVS